MKNKLSSFVLMCSTVITANAYSDTVYKCIEDDKVTFSQFECEGAQEETRLQIKHATPEVKESNNDFVYSAKNKNKVGNKQQQSNNAVVADLMPLVESIREQESLISQLTSQMKTQLTNLRASQNLIKGDESGGNWHQAINQEIKAVSESYQSQIDAAKNKLDELKAAEISAKSSRVKATLVSSI